MGDFNEVRSIDERFGSMFNQSSSRLFNYFITSSGLVDVKLEGYSFTRAHPSATKMSKLDRFLVSKDTNGLIRFEKKLQDLNKIICSWIKDKKLQQSGAINSIIEDLIGDIGGSFDLISVRLLDVSLKVVFFEGKATSDGLFKGIQIQGSMAISHLFYADDAVFIGEWSDSNLDNIVKILKCLFLASWLKINIQKSQVLGVGVPRNIVSQAASLIGCAVMQNPFRCLGVMVGNSMSQKLAWADTVQKLRSRLSKWKVKTLSIGGRLTLLKSVLGASPLYNMSIYKVHKGVPKEMEAIQCNFFNGADPAERKITWVSWDKVLASKKNSFGVSSFHALNRALLLKWVWHFLSQDGSLWYRVIQALYGASFELHPVNQSSIWCSILHRWICDLNGDGVFRVKEVRTILDDIFLPSAVDATRWVKFIPIKINVFAWRARLERLSTRSNLVHRGVVLDSSLCPLCGLVPNDIHHVLFWCDTAKLVFRRICR
nr:RNA-directed DNA polymerase, eukaryota [Tanacetum cinerariifolium]